MSRSSHWCRRRRVAIARAETSTRLDTSVINICVHRILSIDLHLRVIVAHLEHSGRALSTHPLLLGLGLGCCFDKARSVLLPHGRACAVVRLRAYIVVLH